MNPIQQIIEHPAIEEMRAKYEVEVGEVRQELEKMTDDRDEWQEKAEGADDCVDRERTFLGKVFVKTNKETGKDEEVEISITDLKNAIKSFKSPRWNGEYGIMDSFVEVLDHLKAEKREIEYKEIVKEKEVLPNELKINGVEYKKQ